MAPEPKLCACGEPVACRDGGVCRDYGTESHEEHGPGCLAHVFDYGDQCGDCAPASEEE